MIDFTVILPFVMTMHVERIADQEGIQSVQVSARSPIHLLVDTKTQSQLPLHLYNLEQVKLPCQKLPHSCGTANLEWQDGWTLPATLELSVS